MIPTSGARGGIGFNKIEEFDRGRIRSGGGGGGGVMSSDGQRGGD